MTQIDKGRTFRDLHEARSAFVIPNPWDIGTAKLLASLGFQALATTSAGFAFSRGLPDGAVGFEAMIHHCREMAAATDLPLQTQLLAMIGSWSRHPQLPTSPASWIRPSVSPPPMWPRAGPR